MVLGIIITFLAGSMQLSLGSQAAKQGRQGNNLLEAEQYEEASETYQEGLNAYSNNRSVDDTYFGLQNNLGVSLFRQEEFEQAQAAFDAALAHAPSAVERARVAYNAGNNAFNRQEAEAALAHYQDALLSNPDDENAKFNFEFVKRWIQQQEEQENQQQNNDEEQEEQDNQEQEQQGQQQEDESQENEPQQDEQQQQQSEEETESDAQPQESSDTELTRQQAEQILEALENEEQELLRQIQKVQGQRRRVAKDW